MKMRMVKAGSVPTVKYGEKADLGAQMFRIGSDGGQVSGRGSEQNAVDEIFVLVSDGSDLFGDREDDMEIVCRENFGRSFFRPTRHARATGTLDSGDHDRSRNRAAGDYSRRIVRDDRQGLRCDTLRSRS